MDKGLHTVKSVSRKVVPKAHEFIKNKIADVVTKSNKDNTAKQKAVTEITISPRRKR